MPAWEWIVFVGNHARADTGQWKEKFNNAPLIVKKVTENGGELVCSNSVFSI